jgi:hypothetical protein
MKKIHVIFAGDSFSDDGREVDVFDLTYLKSDDIKYSDMCAPTTIKLHSFFGVDLANQNKNNIVIHTLGRGSYGNHVISDVFKQKVNELKLNNPDDEIYGIIQFSAFVRYGLSTTGSNACIKIEDYPYDYMNENSKEISEREIFVKHFENIENLNKFCLDNQVKHFMFFGWANIFSDDIKRLHLENEINSLKKIINFYEYIDNEDEIKHYCFGEKKLKKSDNLFYNTYHILGDSFGGLSEYCRDRLKMGERYNLISDPHPSTKAYYLFYTEIIRKFFIELGIIDDLPIPKKIMKMIENVFKYEYIRFTTLRNTNYEHIHDIMKICIKIFYQDRMVSLKKMEQLFVEYNNTLKKHLF